MNGWDGIWSVLVGGALSGAVVFGGIWIAQQKADQSEDKRERNKAAARLVREVSNLRDAATRSTDGRNGNFELWPLRNTVLEAKYLFASNPKVLDEVTRFAARTRQYRSWLRADYGGAGETDAVAQSDAEGFRQRLNANAESVFKVLQGDLDARNVEGFDDSNFAVTWVSTPPADYHDDLYP